MERKKMENHPLTILHTSDWHLGRTLYGRRRNEVFSAFLDWMVHSIQEHHVDILVISGDIFDTSAPGNLSQEMYYRFLSRAMQLCRHIVIVAGNHDSPSFLTAPQSLLRALNVHTIGTAGTPEEETLILRGPDGDAELIVCAVPYLRDRDIRTVAPGESLEDKERNLAEGIRRHYAMISEYAEKCRVRPDLPVLATGHLFTDGGQTSDGDGVRQLYVGSLAYTAADCFPGTFDYLALGHLHIPQKVGGAETRRYSGSPLPMGFGEKENKVVCLVTFTGRNASVQCLPVPVFQELVRIQGPWPLIEQRMKELAATHRTPWLEVIYTGNEIIGDLRDRVERLAADTGMEVLRIRNGQTMAQALDQNDETDSLDALDPDEVFERCLTAHNVPETQRPELRMAYREILDTLQQKETSLS